MRQREMLMILSIIIFLFPFLVDAMSFAHTQWQKCTRERGHPFTVFRTGLAAVDESMQAGCLRSRGYFQSSSKADDYYTHEGEC